MSQVFLVSFVSYLNDEKTSIITSLTEKRWETLKIEHSALYSLDQHLESFSTDYDLVFLSFHYISTAGSHLKIWFQTQIKAAPCQKNPCMLLVLSHTPGALCSVQQCLIFVYWGCLYTPALHTGGPKFTHTMFAQAVYSQQLPQAGVHIAFSFETMTEVELNLLLFVRLQWTWKAVSSPESSGFTAGVLGQALGVSLLEQSDPGQCRTQQYCSLSSEVGLLVETAQNLRKSRAESLRKAFKNLT